MTLFKTRPFITSLSRSQDWELFLDFAIVHDGAHDRLNDTQAIKCAWIVVLTQDPIA